MLPKASPSKRKVYIDSLFGERVQRAEQLRAKNQAKALAESQASSSDSKESDMEKIVRGVQVVPSGG
ncbi:hypothetical protein G6514_006179 [Epicoccum nigrum]|jgi:hypothetical protein|nr:hypothetical protein G6514_006179 [Epicoccum nigrum]